MRFVISFSCSNDAFVAQPREQEVARILREVAKKVEQGWASGVVLDINGNRVGDYDYREH